MFQWLKKIINSFRKSGSLDNRVELQRKIANPQKKLEKEAKDLFRQDRWNNATKALKEQGVLPALKAMSVSYKPEKYQTIVANNTIREIAQEREESF